MCEYTGYLQKCKTPAFYSGDWAASLWVVVPPARIADAQKHPKHTQQNTKKRKIQETGSGKIHTILVGHK